MQGEGGEGFSGNRFCWDHRSKLWEDILGPTIVTTSMRTHTSAVEVYSDAWS